MLIANPIYDVVFKYLMEDAKIAKLLIGSIIDCEILDLEFRPKSFSAKVTRDADAIKPFFTIYYLDFSAKIKTAQGEEKLVVIEVQKAKLPTDIIRFRRYLGQQYSNKNNFYLAPNKEGKTVRKALPIISIYFLGHTLDNIHGIPVIQVNRKYLDAYSKTEITQKDQFIESLTHDSYIISIEDLKERRRNELEILLSIFDQDNRTEDQHILNVREEDFPLQFRPIIRRLQHAVEVPEIRDNMEAEDTILEEFEDQERRALDAERMAKEARQGEQEALLQITQEKQRAEQAQQQVAEAQLKRRTSIQRMKAAGFSIAEIANLLDLSPEEIEGMTNESNVEWTECRITRVTSEPNVE